MDILSVVLAFDIAVPETRLNRKIKLPHARKGTIASLYPSPIPPRFVRRGKKNSLSPSLVDIPLPLRFVYQCGER